MYSVTSLNLMPNQTIVSITTNRKSGRSSAAVEIIQSTPMNKGVRMRQDPLLCDEMTGRLGRE